MYIVKWDTIKDKVACNLPGVKSWEMAIYGLMASMGQRSWRKDTEILRNKVIDIVLNWDIRKAGKLIELFPFAIPKKYQGQKFVAEIDDKQNWVLIFD